jgi:hypothetical protein
MIFFFISLTLPGCITKHTEKKTREDWMVKLYRDIFDLRHDNSLNHISYHPGRVFTSDTKKEGLTTPL